MLTKHVLVVAGALASCAQATAQRIDVPYARLQSALDSSRINAFYEMVAAAALGQPTRPGGGPRIELLAARAQRQGDLSLALISLLERETIRMTTAPKDPLPEGFGTGYYPDVFVTVARLKDPRSINALAAVIEQGHTVTSALASFGNAAVPAVSRMLQSTDRLERSAAARTLGSIAGRRAELGINGASLAQIRLGLLKALDNQDDFILRRNAVDALDSFSDGDVRAAMERVAASDTYSTLKGRTVVYPIRDKARAWLASHRK